MLPVNRLQLHILQDELSERWERFCQQVRNVFPRRHNRIGLSLSELSCDVEGRVWVEVGGDGLRLRVSHLHPANPTLSEILLQKRLGQVGKPDGQGMPGNQFPLPDEDEVSLSSLEDYWFNHWQGPHINPDSNQNSVDVSKIRRSHHKLRRTLRCSMCKKKIVNQKEDGAQSFEQDENVLAHIPTVKPETRSFRDDLVDKSEEETYRQSNSDDSLSRYSVSDEQLARVHRIIDNEMRKSFSLFAEETVNPDVVDGEVSMEAGNTGGEDALFHQVNASSHGPWQSRSCPCSPKLARLMGSPSSTTNSPKSRSFVGISSKFSLSSSLLTVHRQASNSFISDFLKHETAAGASKTHSNHNSIPCERKASVQCAGDAFSFRDDAAATVGLVDENAPSSPQETMTMLQKLIVQEVHSLPTLKLSKMSLTYKGGMLIRDAKCTPPPSPEVHSCDSQGSLNAFGAAAETLPDIVTSASASSSDPASAEGSFGIDPKKGCMNIGFDGNEKSSDYLDTTDSASPNTLKEAVTLKTQSLECRGLSSASPGGEHKTVDMPGIYAISVGHSSQPVDYSQAVSVHLPCSGESNTDNLSSEAPVGEVQKDTQQERQSIFPALGAPAADLQEVDPMQEARNLVYWWQRKSGSVQDETEYCLHQAECRAKQKPLLLFLHDIGDSADVWTQQLWYFLSCGYEVVAPDMLGHGLSSAPDKAKLYTFSSVLEHISLIFDLFVPQGRNCVVIGHGYGCALTAALARGRPSNVRLIVMASCGGPSPLVPMQKEGLISKYCNACIFPCIKCGCIGRDTLFMPRGRHFMESSGIQGDACSTSKYVLDHVKRGQVWSEGDLAFHRRITVPSLLLYGMKDKKVSLVEMCEMERTIPRAFLEIITDSGHEIMTDSPLSMCQSIHKFIKRWKTEVS